MTHCECRVMGFRAANLSRLRSSAVSRGQDSVEEGRTMLAEQRALGRWGNPHSRGAWAMAGGQAWGGAGDQGWGAPLCLQA